MFELHNTKRPAAEKVDHGVRLKKTCTIASRTNPGTQLPDICSHYGLIGQDGANLLSQSSCFTPQYPQASSENYVPYQVEPPPDNTSLPTLTNHDNSDDSTLRTNPQSIDGVDSLDEELSLEDNDVVPRVCFGAVSCSILSTSTTTNTIRLL
jgi:hypothetical protein